ncbi:unnamed protein product [Rotaria magnacalcarata]
MFLNIRVINKIFYIVAVKFLLNIRDIVSPYAIGSSCSKLVGLRLHGFNCLLIQKQLAKGTERRIFLRSQ